MIWYIFPAKPLPHTHPSCPLPRLYSVIPETLHAQRICRQCHQNVIEDEEHFFFHCQKNELLRKEFLTQIENVYPKLMGNKHIQNLDFFFIFFVSYTTCCPFHSKVISSEESNLIKIRSTHLLLIFYNLFWLLV